jgi:membrane protease subunit (stomatin/prohibitin family)
MKYKILVQRAGSAFSTDFERAAQELSNRVNEALREDWQLQGGLAVGRTKIAEISYLMQAVVKLE